MSIHGNGEATTLQEVGAAVVDHELSAVQTPEALARANVAAAERLMGRPATRAEVGEMSDFYSRCVIEFARIAAERS